MSEYPVYLNLRQPLVERYFSMVDLIHDEFNAIHRGYKKKQEKGRKGILRKYEEMEQKRKAREEEKNGTKKRFNFTYVMIGVIILFIVITALMKIQSTHVRETESREKIDYYDILGITDKRVSTREIKRAYKRAARKYHPDVCQLDSEEECSNKMSLANEANIVLMNPELRKYHDTYGVRPEESMIKMAQAKHGKNL